jgi:hypothetical protein
MNKKYLPYILFGIPIVIALIFIKKATAQPKIDVTPTPDSGGSSGGGGDTKPPTKRDNFPLKKGSKGDKVIELQKAINNNSSANLVPDGDFGNKTEKALLDLTYKKTVDSQAELDRIGKSKERKELAQKMVAKINENPTINHFRALEPAAFTEIKFTSDGLRELPREAFSVKAGFRIYPQNSKSIQVSNDGFITIVYNDKKQVFSPYPFEVTNKIL